MFAWRGRPGVVEKLTPPWEHVKALSRDESWSKCLIIAIAWGWKPSKGNKWQF
jgi:hypothetical protein